MICLVLDVHFQVFVIFVTFIADMALMVSQILCNFVVLVLLNRSKFLEINYSSSLRLHGPFYKAYFDVFVSSMVVVGTSLDLISTTYVFLSFLPGLPKAAVITQLQALKGSFGLWAFGCTTDDIIYITLPLYHSSGSLLGIGGCIELGKFSFSV